MWYKTILILSAINQYLTIPLNLLWYNTNMILIRYVRYQSYSPILIWYNMSDMTLSIQSDTNTYDRSLTIWYWSVRYQSNNPIPIWYDTWWSNVIYKVVILGLLIFGVYWNRGICCDTILKTTIESLMSSMESAVQRFCFFISVRVRKLMFQIKWKRGDGFKAWAVYRGGLAQQQWVTLGCKEHLLELTV